jgi:hypothetical protein
MPKCNAKHPTLDLRCGLDRHEPTEAHKATDEDGNPHAWVTEDPED